MDIERVTKFIFEINQLKFKKQSGWYLSGIKNPPSVAEHVMRAAQIGYILAIMEGDANPEKVASILLVHDNGEARIGDQDKIAARYYEKNDAEMSAFSEQIQNLGEKIEKNWQQYFEEFEKRKTKEGMVAKDADWLEVAFQAKEYLDLGCQSAEDWIGNVEKALETESAKKIISEMKKINFTDWWKGLKKMTYEKIS